MVAGEGDKIDPLRTDSVDDRLKRCGSLCWEEYLREGVSNDVHFPFDVSNVTRVVSNPRELERLTYGVRLRLLAEGRDEAVVV